MGAAEKLSLVFAGPPDGVSYIGKTSESMTVSNERLGVDGTQLWSRASE